MMVDVVVKVGGSLLAHPGTLDAVLRALGEAAREHRMLLVPGGGPFADLVRAVDRQLALGDDCAHWMAVLGMDQYAHVIASRLAESAVVDEPADIDAVTTSGRLAVLAPSRWLRQADPLPHCWDVTSDSIAAWVAGAVAATRLVLVKPPGASGRAAVDAYFDRALPAGVDAVIVAADQMATLGSALRFHEP